MPPTLTQAQPPPLWTVLIRQDVDGPALTHHPSEAIVYTLGSVPGVLHSVNLDKCISVITVSQSILIGPETCVLH